MVRLKIILLILFTSCAFAKSPIYDIGFETINGQKKTLADFAEKPILIVNVASQCGYTPQYAGLQLLHEKYKEKGLNIIGFPCNDFGGQEPGSNNEIEKFCKANYNVSFTLASKVKLRGEDAHPLYQFLQSEKTNPDFFGSVKWNFEKFLIDGKGKVVNRFRQRVRPTSSEIVSSVEWELMTVEGKKKAYDDQGPPALLEYKGREIARTMHWQGAPWLMRKLREEEEKTSEMINELKLKPGISVADIGSGNGYHTLMMAKIIGEKGQAYAVDIQPEMLIMLEERAKKAGMENIKLIENRFWDADLPEKSVDFVLMADVYHEFSHPQQMLSSIKKSLKEDGVVCLLEFKSEDPKVPIKPEHKMSKAQVIKEMSSNGFVLSRSYDKLPWQHLLFFKSNS
ncbi:MAG: methyltransferase domain-containing protein [Verrucomicrobiales bacterium]|nr:methyltransferase domain-containing protein [Verrucomicrobiales bacterium]